MLGSNAAEEQRNKTEHKRRKMWNRKTICNDSDQALDKKSIPILDHKKLTAPKLGMSCVSALEILRGHNHIRIQKS